MSDNQGQVPPGGGNGEPPLETRVSKLEAATEKTSAGLAAIDRDISVLKGEVSSFKQEAFRAFATKTDVAEAKNSIIMWVVSAILLAQLLPALLKNLGL
jgi:hypothetical protein